MQKTQGDKYIDPKTGTGAVRWPTLSSTTETPDITEDGPDSLHSHLSLAVGRFGVRVVGDILKKGKGGRSGG